MRVIQRACAAAFVCVLTFATVSVASAAALSDTSSRTFAQVRTRWASARPTYAGSPFLVTPSVIAPYAVGRLQPGFVTDALRKANFARYLTGLPDDLAIDAAYADEVQHSAVVLAAIGGGLSHAPAKPPNMPQAFFDIGLAGTGSSNLAAGARQLHSTVDMYLDDSDSSNIDRIGHRRWVLNPPMAKTGFGYAEKSGSTYGAYSAMHAFDRSRTSAVSYAHFGWPSAGPFPLEFFANGTAWSIHLDPGDYDYVGTGIVVTLTRVADGAVWTFDAADSSSGTPGAGEYFAFSGPGYGDPACIIFRPALTMRYSSGDAFDVRVSGKLYANNSTNPVQIAYRTTFFRLDSASDPVPPASCTIGLSTESSASLAYGSTLVVAGTLASGAGLSGQRVILQSAAVGASFKDTTLSVTTGAGGAFAFSVKPAIRTSYRARFAGSTGYAAAGPTASVYAMPHAWVGTPVAPAKMSHAKSYNIYAYMKPRHASGSYPVRIYKWRLVSGTWVAYGYSKAKASNNSTYTKCARSVRLPYRGTWRLRAYAPADSGHTSTWSGGYKVVTVT